MTRKDLVKKILNENFNLLVNLRERWEDEKEYEDINDYLEHIQKSIPEAYKIIKRPFGIDCKADDGDIRVFLKVEGSYITLYSKTI